MMMKRTTMMSQKRRKQHKVRWNLTWFPRYIYVASLSWQPFKPSPTIPCENISTFKKPWCFNGDSTCLPRRLPGKRSPLGIRSFRSSCSKCKKLFHSKPEIIYLTDSFFYPIKERNNFWCWNEKTVEQNDWKLSILSLFWVRFGGSLLKNVPPRVSTESFRFPVSTLLLKISRGGVYLYVNVSGVNEFFCQWFQIRPIGFLDTLNCVYLDFTS